MRDSRTYRAARRNLYKLTRRHNPKYRWDQMFSWENPDLRGVPSPKEVRHALTR